MSNPSLLSLQEILNLQVDVNNDYLRLQMEVGLESLLDLRRLGLVLDNNFAALESSPGLPPRVLLLIW